MEWFNPGKVGRPIELTGSGINITDNYIYFSKLFFTELAGRKIQVGYDGITQEVVLKINDKGHKVSTVGALKNTGMIRSPKLNKWLESIGVSGKYKMVFDSANKLWRGSK